MNEIQDPIANFGDCECFQEIDETTLQKITTIAIVGGITVLATYGAVTLANRVGQIAEGVIADRKMKQFEKRAKAARESNTEETNNEN